MSDGHPHEKTHDCGHNSNKEFHWNDAWSETRTEILKLCISFPDMTWQIEYKKEKRQVHMTISPSTLVMTSQGKDLTKQVPILSNDQLLC